MGVGGESSRFLVEQRGEIVFTAAGTTQHCFDCCCACYVCSFFVVGSGHAKLLFVVVYLL